MTLSGLKKIMITLLLAAYLVNITGCILPGYPPPPMENKEIMEENTMEDAVSFKETDYPMEVHFIDVGQGDATLIINGDAAMLIDAGDNDMGTFLQLYLQKQNIEKLDYLILTHTDADHIGGADVIITKFDIETVFMGDYAKDSATYRDVMDSLEYKSLTWTTPKPGSTYSLEDALITIIGPIESYDAPNNTSICLLIQKGAEKFLFTGDAEEEAEMDLIQSGMSLAADVYHAGHHGSSTSSTEEFLKAVSPAYCVISCGEGNDYGHPHAGVLNNLRKMGIEVYRTDEQGSIIATCDGISITWNCAPSDSWKPGEWSSGGHE